MLLYEKILSAQLLLLTDYDEKHLQWKKINEFEKIFSQCQKISRTRRYPDTLFFAPLAISKGTHAAMESRAALLLRRAEISTLVQQGERALEESTSSCRAGSSPMQPCAVLHLVQPCATSPEQLSTPPRH